MSNLAYAADAKFHSSAIRLTAARASYFLLGQDENGDWIVREKGGRKGGIFKSREAALRFARLESCDRNFAVIHVFDGMTFDYGT